MNVFFWGTCLLLLGGQALPATSPATLAAAPSNLPSASDVSRLQAQAQTLLQPILAHPGLRGAQVGLYVLHLNSATPLFEHHAEQLLVPASNIKLLTTAAALSELTPDYQFPTEFYGVLQPNGSLSGDLWVKGYGDPYLIPERLYYIATRLWYRGVRHIHGDIVIDSSFFEGPRVAYGWQEDQSSHAYMAPAGAVSVGFNALLIHVLPGSVAGQPARVLLDPPSTYAAIYGQVRTVARSHGILHVNLETRLPNNTQPVSSADIAAADANRIFIDSVRVSGSLGVKNPGRTFWRRITQPDLYAGAIFKHTLAQVGIGVDGNVRLARLETAASNNAAPPKLLSYGSPRLAELVGPLNKYSNNFMASQIAYALGAHQFGPPGSWEKGKAALQSFLHERVGLSPNSFTLNNASGLHEVNRFSAHQIAQIIQYMYSQPQLWPEFVSSLAVAGGMGTLQDRMADSNAAGVLRAKTGTLAGASALSGFILQQGGTPLAFSMLVNSFHNLTGVWQAQDRLGIALEALSASAAATPPPAALAEDSSKP